MPTSSPYPSSSHCINHVVLSRLFIGVLLIAGCTTKPVPGICCIDPEGCMRIGSSEARPCSDGLACIDLQCMTPSCSAIGCSAEAPICDVTTDSCIGCSGPSDCSRFGEIDVCDLRTGACVECVSSTDCTDVEPVCQEGACRGCQLDAECASGACGDDGICVAESSIVYLSPDGDDTGDCTRAAPCKEPQFGVGRTSSTRSNIVLAPGTYFSSAVIITPSTTTAPQVTIHGGGARLFRYELGGAFLVTKLRRSSEISRSIIR